MKYGFVNQKCPKCGGNLYFDRDYCIEGSFISLHEEETCLQCGSMQKYLLQSKAVAAATGDKVMPTMRQLVAV